MKKIFVLSAFVAVFLISCHNEEKTDNSKPYQTTDTNRVEPKNSPADSGHHESGS